MYEKGDYVIYGKSGVCAVEKVGTLDMPGVDSSRTYYTLRPIYTTETIFTPVDTKVFMRPAITQEEAIGLIKQIPEIESDMDLELDLDNKTMPDYYKSLLTTHDCKDLIRLILIIHSRAQKAVEAKKRICQTDQNFMRDAESILYGELSVALGIEMDKVPEFISRMIGEETDTPQEDVIKREA